MVGTSNKSVPGMAIDYGKSLNLIPPQLIYTLYIYIYGRIVEDLLSLPIGRAATTSSHGGGIGCRKGWKAVNETVAWLGFYDGFMGFYRDLMGFYSDFLRIL